MTLINFLLYLNHTVPDAVEHFVIAYAVMFILVMSDTVMKLFALTITKYSLWHYKAIIQAFWGGWGQQKSSRVFYRGFVFKIFQYSIACLIAFALDCVNMPKELPYALKHTFNYIAFIIYFVIFLTELFSFKENYELIKYNKSVTSKFGKDLLEHIDTIDLNLIKFKLNNHIKEDDKDE